MRASGCGGVIQFRTKERGVCAILMNVIAHVSYWYPQCKKVGGHRCLLARELRNELMET